MKTRLCVVALILGLTVAAPLADTLVLQNGRRVQGTLVGVDGRDIEFEERGAGRRIIRVPRQEIARIEFDDERTFGIGDAPAVTSIPRGMRERRVNVTAREAWTDTGIDVRRGQEIYFESDGEVRWGPNRRDSAAGERNSPVNPGRPLPDRPAASLIGRIGDDIFFIGADPGPFRMRAAGRLFLGINDDVFQDNSGNLRIVMSY